MTVVDDIYFCDCNECGAHMTLGYSKSIGKYIAVCELCKRYQILNDQFTPPTAPSERKIH